MYKGFDEIAAEVKKVDFKVFIKNWELTVLAAVVLIFIVAQIAYTLTDRLLLIGAGVAGTVAVMKAMRQKEEKEAGDGNGQAES